LQKEDLSAKDMENKDSIRITSGLHKDYSTDLVIDGKKYLILTEDIDPARTAIITTVYYRGKILSTRTIDVRNVTSSPDFKKKLAELVYKQHEMIAAMLKQEHDQNFKKPSHYLNEVKSLLQKKNNKGALELITYALKQYPDEPVLLSYYGCLEAIINKNYQHAIDTCLRAIEKLEERLPFGREFFASVFYLNLGRAYRASGNKTDAVNAFQKGLSFDKDNKDILWELMKLGMRKRPFVPYLKRGNLINKYIGMMLHKLKKV
jgi:tetratricopeptide (TPR) repeat protein